MRTIDTLGVKLDYTRQGLPLMESPGARAPRSPLINILRDLHCGFVPRLPPPRTQDVGNGREVKTCVAMVNLRLVVELQPRTESLIDFTMEFSHLPTFLCATHVITVGV